MIVTLPGGMSSLKEGKTSTYQAAPTSHGGTEGNSLASLNSTLKQEAHPKWVGLSAAWESKDALLVLLFTKTQLECGEK
jgi:hypothetical protein